jgi:hypothetical protein
MRRRQRNFPGFCLPVVHPDVNVRVAVRDGKFNAANRPVDGDRFGRIEFRTHRVMRESDGGGQDDTAYDTKRSFAHEFFLAASSRYFLSGNAKTYSAKPVCGGLISGVI